MKRSLWMFLLVLLMPVSAAAIIVDVRVSTPTSAGATISWITDSEVSGYVRYSEDPDLSGALIAHDVRGQSFEGCTHYVKIAHLKKETTYYFEVVSGSDVSTIHDFKTMKEPPTPPGFCLAYGFTYQEGGTTSAEGAIVYLSFTHDGIDSYPLSRLIGPQGSFLFNIMEARNTQTDDLFPSIDPGDSIRVEAVYCDDDRALKTLAFSNCTFDCGPLIMGENSTTTTTAGSSTTTTAGSSTTTTAGNSTTTTVPTTTTTSSAVTTTVVTTTSIPVTTSTIVPVTTTTTAGTSSTTTTTISSTTTTIVPQPAYEVAIDPPYANILPFGTIRFTARTSLDGEIVEGEYRWYVDSAKGSRISKNGLYQAGAFPETVMVMVVDTKNKNSTASATVNVAQFWPAFYEEMWGENRVQTISTLRSFRDTVMVDNKLGREYVSLLYENSTEIAVLLMFNPLLRMEVKNLMDVLLVDVKSILDGKKTVISRKKVRQLQTVLNHFEQTAVSQRLKKALRKVSSDLRKDRVFKQFDVFVGR